VLSRADHPISRRAISKNTLKVLYRLHDAGHIAYLVGGGVRDLMLGRTPKDFDVATSARPEEVRAVFRNSRTIGRRFRLVHVFFHGEIVEVSTFRRGIAVDESAEANGDLLITDDNVFGNPAEDAFRRDFTVNALFYDIADFSVIDYVGGIADLRGSLIRVIGNPDVRFREDPVRMLRACEFAGRLGFTIEAQTQSAIHRHRREIERAAAARLTEELVHLLRCGSAGAAMQWALDLGLLEVLLPEAYAMIAAGERGLGDFGQILPVVDRLVASGRQVPEGGLLAALLLPQVLLRRYDVEAVAQRPLTRAGIQELVRETVEPFFTRFALPRGRATEVMQALIGFHRLCEGRLSAGERLRMAHKPYFDDALLLFEVLVRATGEGREELERWQAAGRRARSAEDSGSGLAVDPEVRDAREPTRRRRRGRRRR
jgi:poly(A) polymerase